MIRRNTWIAVGALAMLVVVAVTLGRGVPERPEQTPTAAPEPIWELESTDIVGMVVEDLRQLEVLELTRDEEDLWRMLRPEQMPVDASRVERAASWLSSPTPRAELFDSLDLSAFELDEPHYRIEIVTRSGDHYSLDVGREAPTGGSRYATSEDRLGVLVMSTAGLDEVLDLQSDLMPTPTPEPTPAVTPSAPPEDDGEQEGGS